MGGGRKHQVNSEMDQHSDSDSESFTFLDVDRLDPQCLPNPTLVHEENRGLPSSSNDGLAELRDQPALNMSASLFEQTVQSEVDANIQSIADDSMKLILDDLSKLPHALSQQNFQSEADPNIQSIGNDSVTVMSDAACSSEGSACNSEPLSSTEEKAAVDSDVYLRIAKLRSICHGLGGTIDTIRALVHCDLSIMYNLSQVTRLREEVLGGMPKVKLALVGRTKAGKSALGRALVGAKVFKSALLAETMAFWAIESGSSFEIIHSQTGVPDEVLSFPDLASLERHCAVLSRPMGRFSVKLPISFDENLSIVDSMGYSEAGQDNLVRTYTRDEAHGLIMVLDLTSGGLMREDLEFLEFVPLSVLKNTVFVLTKLDCLRRNLDDGQEENSGSFDVNAAADEVVKKFMDQIRRIAPAAEVLVCGGLAKTGMYVDENERDRYVSNIREAIHGLLGGQSRRPVVDAWKDRLVMELNKVTCGFLKLNGAASDIDAAFNLERSRLDERKRGISEYVTRRRLDFRLFLEERLAGLLKARLDEMRGTFGRYKWDRLEVVDRHVLKAARATLCEELMHHVQEFWGDGRYGDGDVDVSSDRILKDFSMERLNRSSFLGIGGVFGAGFGVLGLAEGLSVAAVTVPYFGLVGMGIGLLTHKLLEKREQLLASLDIDWAVKNSLESFMTHVRERDGLVLRVLADLLTSELRRLCDERMQELNVQYTQKLRSHAGTVDVAHTLLTSTNEILSL